MGNYLVTGAAGFIGSAIAHRLEAEGHEITAIDNLRTGFRENLPKSARFIEGGCQDKSTYRELGSQKFDAIYHLAGQSSGEISFDDPVYDLQTNTQSTLYLLNYALENGCDRFLYASTMSVYGAQPEEPIDENRAQKPLSFYGVGKIASEHYLRIYEDHGIRSTALRLFNVYGPGQNLNNLRQGMVSIFLIMALRDKKVHVKGHADRFRDFVYIDDVVEAFLRCENNPSTHGRVFNVGTGLKTTIGELLNNMKSHITHPVDTLFDGGTPGDQFGIFADTSALYEVLGWKPEVQLKEGLKRMVKWAKGTL
jgi:UDP-glucose 4-epimerase